MEAMHRIIAREARAAKICHYAEMACVAFAAIIAVVVGAGMVG